MVFFLRFFLRLQELTYWSIIFGSKVSTNAQLNKYQFRNMFFSFRFLKPIWWCFFFHEVNEPQTFMQQKLVTDKKRLKINGLESLRLIFFESIHECDILFLTNYCCVDTDNNDEQDPSKSLRINEEQKKTEAKVEHYEKLLKKVRHKTFCFSSGFSSFIRLSRTFTAQ